MYGGLADAEFFCRRANGRAVLYEVKGQLTGPFFPVTFDSSPLPRCTSAVHTYAGAAAKSTVLRAYYR